MSPFRRVDTIDASRSFVVDIHKFLSHKIPSIVALFGVVLGFLATLWWAFVFFTVGPDSLPMETTPQAPAPSDFEVPIDRVVAMHLFGEPGSDIAPRTETLSETKLSLVLHGVFVSDMAEASTAVVSQRGNNPRLYAIADRLPGNARLEEVHRDRVVISRGGVRENLSFEREDQMITPGTSAQPGHPGRARSADRPPPAPRAQKASDTRNPRSLIERTLAKHRDEIDQNPRKFIEALGLTTSDRGGYTLGTFADNDTGLERGDRLLSLNGKPVGNPAQDRRQLERILAGRAVEIQLQRGEQIIKFSLSLDLD